MQLPTLEKSIPVSETSALFAISGETGVTPQGCNALEWIGCAAAVAACVGLSGPALVACVAAAAPGCVKCL